MKIEWVNHASFILEYGNVRLIMDPWLEGTAFDNGWALLSDTRLQYSDFSRITHIWFSHEHPDHFSPPNLKRIPQDIQKNITVLYHETIDRKVVQYCRGLGFGNVVELKEDQWVNLAPDLKILNNRFEADSWLCVKTPTETILNLNDCEIGNVNDLTKIKQRVGDVDILFTQFSYAGFAGNQDDLAGRKKRALAKLNQMGTQIDVLQPKKVVPFASFVWFCHEENYYMNKGINTIRDAVDYLSTVKKVQPVVLYPGEVWDTQTDHDTEQSLRCYDADYEKVFQSPKLITAPTIAFDKLQRTADEYIKRMLKVNNSLMIRRFPPAYVFVTDYGHSVELSVQKGLVKADKPYEECDIALSSEALEYCMKYPWGGETIWISGRLQLPPRGTYRRFKNFTAVGGLNNHGIKFGLGFAVKYVSRKLTQKLRQR